MNKIFTTTSNGALPPYGESVLIFANGVVQNVTYMLDGADDSPDWFQPYHFGDDGDLYLSIEEVDGWCLIGDPINEYDANQKTITILGDSVHDLAVDNLKQQERIAELEAALLELIDTASQCDSWESFPSDALDDATAAAIGETK